MHSSGDVRIQLSSLFAHTRGLTRLTLFAYQSQAPKYPSLHGRGPPRDLKTRKVVDPYLNVSVKPLDAGHGEAGSGGVSPDNPFKEQDGSSEDEQLSKTNLDDEPAEDGDEFVVSSASMTGKKRKAPFTYTDSKRKEIADAMVRYCYYCEKGVCDDDDFSFAAPPKQEWLERVLNLVPPYSKQPTAGTRSGMSKARFETLIISFMEEMRADHRRASKKAVVDYALCDQHTRTRLGVDALFPFLPVSISQ